MKVFDKLFEYDNSSASHIVLTIFGIKLRLLRSELRNQRSEYKNIYQNSDLNNLPQAQGALRLVQTANLGFLQIFDDICKRNNIRYWLDFGTLLGAKRHKGFIPWDDDIDVGMPRDDYERFIKIFADGIESNPDLYYEFNCNHRNKCYIKFHHKKSKNIFIDIFPYDYYYKSVNEEEKKEISQKLAKLVQPNFLRYFRTEESTRKYLKNRTQKYILNGNAADPNSKPALFWGIDFPHRWVNKVYDYQNIFPLTTIEFEGKAFPAPNMTHEVLSSIYGDYMTIPKDVYPRHSGIEFDDEEYELLTNLSKGNF